MNWVFARLSALAAALCGLASEKWRVSVLVKQILASRCGRRG